MVPSSPLDFLVSSPTLYVCRELALSLTIAGALKSRILFGEEPESNWEEEQYGIGDTWPDVGELKRHGCSRKGIVAKIVVWGEAAQCIRRWWNR